ncbi:MAG: DUF2306 domain-containing protein [Rhodothalassiaceae bacterium]
MPALSELFGWQALVHSINGGIHLIGALVALVLGPVLFLRRKGTRFHRLAGYAFVLAMLVVNITALATYDFTGGPNLFHGFAVLSLAALLPGFYAIQRAVRTGEPRYLELHVRLMIWAYYGLAAAGFAQIATRLALSVGLKSGLTFALFGLIYGVSGALTGWWTRRAVPKIAGQYRLKRPYRAAPAGETA